MALGLIGGLAQGPLGQNVVGTPGVPGQRVGDVAPGGGMPGGPALPQPGFNAGADLATLNAARGNFQGQTGRQMEMRAPGPAGGEFGSPTNRNFYMR